MVPRLSIAAVDAGATVDDATTGADFDAAVARKMRSPCLPVSAIFRPSRAGHTSIDAITSSMSHVALHVLYLAKHCTLYLRGGMA